MTRDPGTAAVGPARLAAPFAAKAALLAVLGIAFILPMSAGAAFPGGNGKVAYGGDPDILVVNPDGSGEANFGAGNAPAYSPDGRTIAFSRYLNGGIGGPEQALFVMKADGSELTQITFPAGGESHVDPAWSPGGTTLAFSRCSSTPHYPDDGFTSTSCGLVRMPAAGGGLTYLTSTSGDTQDRRASWSPDGATIAFDRYPDEFSSSALYTIRPSGSGQTRLSPVTSATDGAPDWSPDGRKLSFEHAEDIYTMRPDGTGRTQLTTNHPVGSAAWSPDGKKLAVIFSGGGLAIMNANGTGYREVSISDPNAPRPSWQPIPSPAAGDGSGTGTDADSDGYTTRVDCNDADPSIHPAAFDFPGDGIDQDCSGADAQPPSPPPFPVSSPVGGSGTGQPPDGVGSPSPVEASLKLGFRRLVATRRGKIAVPIINPNSFPVRGTMLVKSARPIALVSRKRTLVVARKSFKVAPGAKTIVRLRIPRRVLRTLKRLKRVRVKVVVLAHGPAGQSIKLVRGANLRTARGRR